MNKQLKKYKKKEKIYIWNVQCCFKNLKDAKFKYNLKMKKLKN